MDANQKEGNRRRPPLPLVPWLTGARGMVLLAAVLGLGLGLFVLDRVFPPDLTRVQASRQVVDRDGRLLRVFVAGDGIWRLPTGRAEVDPLFVAMLVAFEDKRFAAHTGIDMLALVRAAAQWAVHGEVVSGASTLTMQVARLLEPRPRTLAAKAVEMARAVQLEARLSKDEVLALYLTLAPYGSNIEGLRAACLTWFGKEPRRLTPGEAALLVALPQAPGPLRPDRHPERARAARAKVIDRMQSLGILSPDQADAARSEPIPLRRRALPTLAPHLAERLLAREPPPPERHDGGPAPKPVPSFIDGALQVRLEALAERRRGELDAQATLALLVADHRSRQVVGYVGAASYGDPDRLGFIDMVRAIRSPGSTLKPFTYALAFDDLPVHPETVIRDVPTRFGDYAPANFNDVHMGDVTLRQALQYSLNVPAVLLLDRLSPARLATALRAVGAEPRFGGGSGPGLPMVLGGVGLSLEDLVGVYATLADGGRTAPLRLSPADPDGTPRPVVSAVAAWYVTDILAGAPPPSGLAQTADAIGGRRIAFKTGTSYGFRDAWAIGYDAHHVIGVWVGRPDATPRADRIGRDTAAPILFAAFDLLPRPAVSLTLPQPPPGTLLARTSELPAALRHFGQPAPGGAAPAEPLVVTFPAEGLTLALADARGGVQVVARGGRRPLAWLVNGRPLEASPWRQDAVWWPDGAGAARIVVIDADGRAASSSVWLE